MNSSFGDNQDGVRVANSLEGFSIVDANDVRADDEGVERLLSYVESRTGGTRMAKRADINPAHLKDLLPEICFFAPVYDDTGALDDVIVKLQGTKAASFYGEHTDQSVRNHPSPEVANRILSSVAKTVKQRCSVIAEATSLSPQKDYLTVKALYVPMAEDGDHIDRFLVYIRVFRKPLFTANG